MIFRTFFLVFTASVRSRPPGPPAVPGVYHLVCRVQITHHFPPSRPIPPSNKSEMKTRKYMMMMRFSFPPRSSSDEVVFHKRKVPYIHIKANLPPTLPLQPWLHLATSKTEPQVAPHYNWHYTAQIHCILQYCRGTKHKFKAKDLGQSISLN